MFLGALEPEKQSDQGLPSHHELLRWHFTSAGDVLVAREAD